MKKRNLAFTVELLGLFILLLLVITVITQVFVMSRSHSLQAKRLTEAVIIAESTAEISSAEKDIDRLAGIFTGLRETDEEAAYKVNNNGGVIMFTRGLSEDGRYKYVVRLERSSQNMGAGDYCEDEICIYSASEVADATKRVDAAGGEREDPMGLISTDTLPEPLYTLKTGKYFREDR